MKIQNLLLGAAVCCSLSSCFKDEAPNAECDIEQAYVHTDDPAEIFFSASDTLVNVPSETSDIVFPIKEGADVSSVAPIFRITDGATISPGNGSAHDFSNGNVVVYTVTSQDGSWKRSYNVSFRPQSTIGNYDFENFRLVNGAAGGQYYEWSDLSDNGEWLGNWASGNPGFNLSRSSAAADEYPTVPVADGYYGSAVKLETKRTGELGELFSMGIAAGNFFIGYFDLAPALTNTLQSTQFGRPFGRRPVSFTGWYKYKSGGVCVDGNVNEIPGTYDQGDIYAVFYRNTDANGKAFVLHGDDVKTSPQIVAIAQVPQVTDAEDWTEFNVDFEYRQEIDPELLANRGYNLAIVCTSSNKGASFCGALGSTLYIDEVKVISEEQ